MTTTTPTGSSVLGDIAIRNKPLHLSKDRLRNVFMNTSDLSRLCIYLSIPDDIKRDVVNVTEYYHKSTQPRKVRKLIFYLDLNGDTALADSVMDCAEPPADPSIIPHHLIPVFQAVTKDWAEIGDPSIGAYIIVPRARAELFRTKFSVSDQHTEAGKYYALYHVDPNWKILSRYLYSAGETLAVDIARPYIQTVTDPTLTPPNLMHAHRHITIWDSEYSYLCLDMPKSQHEEIVAKFDGEEAKLQLFTTWLASHPYPTWDHVKRLLRRLESDGRGREGAADEVEETYIKKTKPVNDSAPVSSSHTTHNTTGVGTPSTTGVSTPSPPSRMNEIPTLPELLTFKTITGDIIDISNKVGTNYDRLGIILLKDKDGSRKNQIVSDCHHQSAAIVLEILTVWVQGGGRHPVTWKTLTDTLKVIGLIVLASDIEQALCH